MPDYTEIVIENALLDIKSGLSIRKSAKKYGILYATLRGWNNGNISLNISN